MHYTPHHTAISVGDLAASLAFYGKLGFQEVHRYEDSDKVGVKLALDRYILEIFAYTQNAGHPKLQLSLGNNLTERGVKHFGLRTDDIEAALKDCVAKGLADVNTQIHSKDTARFFFIEDPDGMGVELIQEDRYRYE